MRFASFLSGGFTTMAVINPPERKLAKRTSVDWVKKSVQIRNLDLECTLKNFVKVLYCALQTYELHFPNICLRKIYAMLLFANKK